jgi:hypothetical protein
LAAADGFVEPPPDQFEWQDGVTAPGDGSELAVNHSAVPPASGAQ